MTTWGRCANNRSCFSLGATVPNLVHSRIWSPQRTCQSWKSNITLVIRAQNIVWEERTLPMYATFMSGFTNMRLPCFWNECQNKATFSSREGQQYQSVGVTSQYLCSYLSNNPDRDRMAVSFSNAFCLQGAGSQINFTVRADNLPLWEIKSIRW